MKSRLFIALNLAPDMLDDIINLRNDISDYNKFLRWEPKEKLHITIQFVGEIDSALIEPIKNLLKNIAFKYSGISCIAENFSLFSKGDIPAILYLNFDFDDSIYKLENELKFELSKLGISKEKREFKPHVTILRLKGFENKNLINSFLEYTITDLTCTLNEIVLYKSELKQSGSVYIPLAKYKLK